MKRTLIVVGVLALGSGALVLQSHATSQDAAAVDEFVLQVDVDGDGLNTPGDRAVLEWWVAHGGDLDTIMNASPIQGDTCNVRAFLDSPAAQLGE